LFYDPSQSAHTQKTDCKSFDDSDDDGEFGEEH
jgi:hypothetical protein